MSLLINDDCIACDACLPECPVDAITEGDPLYIIDPKACVECIGHFDDPQCAAVCPTDACQPDPDNPA